MKPIMLFFALSLGLSAQQVGANYNTNRTNANTAEQRLTPANVATATFHLSCTMTVDDRVFAQPLFVPAVTVSGSVHDLVIVATMNDSLYAFDAASCAQVWANQNFDTPYASYPVAEGGLYGDLGCLSTPVVDVGASKVYAVCDSATGPTWVARAFSLTTGSILYSANLSGQVVGTGDLGVVGGDANPGPPDTTSGANLLFYPRYEFQRAGLALSPDGTKLYIGFGGLNDSRPYHGWLMSRNTSDLSAAAIWCASPNSWGGAVWMSGGAPSIDASGNLYVTTGNGYKTGDPAAVANGLAKLSPDFSTVNTWYPFDETTDDGDDADVSSNRFLLIPGTTFGVVAAKDFYVYLIDTSSLVLAQTAFQTCSSCTPGSASGAYGITFFNNQLIVPTTAGSLYAFAWSGTAFNPTPTWTQTNSYGFPGPAQIAGSCNGASNCLLWINTVATGTHTTPEVGTLRALDPTSGSQFWHSNILTVQYMAKFAAPTVAGGRVFISTMSNHILAFGLISSSDLRGSTVLRGGAVLR